MRRDNWLEVEMLELDREYVGFVMSVRHLGKKTKEVGGGGACIGQIIRLE